MSDVKTKYHYDHSNDRLFIERVQDIEPIIEENKRRMNENYGHSESARWRGDLHFVASVPLVVIEKWCNENGFTFADMMNDRSIAKRFLNSPENAYFRTKPGKI